MIMRSRSKKESKILENYKENRAPIVSDRMYREQARVYHKYLSKLSRQQDQQEIDDELDNYFEEESKQ
jgi:hypothetical protein